MNFFMFRLKKESLQLQLYSLTMYQKFYKETDCFLTGNLESLGFTFLAGKISFIIMYNKLEILDLFESLNVSDPFCNVMYMF